MKVLRAFGFVLLALLGNAGVATAQQPAPPPTPSCAWQFEWSPSGLGNWLFPDTGNRWWYMPIDSRWQKLTITGVFPHARFFSFATYDNAPVATALADRLFDTQIVPDPGSINPIQNPRAASTGRAQKYTIVVTRTDGKAGSDRNELRLHATTGWLIYRLYLPNQGEDSRGGVPLPGISVSDANEHPLPTCQRMNRQSELTKLQPQIVPGLLEDPPLTPPVADRIWFAPLPSPPMRLLPNPDNKYMLSYFMSAYEPGRIIIIRGRMPGFPDTYRGAPVSQPAPGFKTIQMRYWSMCLGDLVSPLPIEGCAVDARTRLDARGFYTIVISDDVLRPDWLPRGVEWLPWGDETMVPKTIFNRNTLPSAGFEQSVQQAIAHRCGVSFKFPTPPANDAIKQAGECSQRVMKEYYPVAVWCDQQKFALGGWQACFRAAGLK